jgi:hypothetical protein
VLLRFGEGLGRLAFLLPEHLLALLPEVLGPLAAGGELSVSFVRHGYIFYELQI